MHHDLLPQAYLRHLVASFFGAIVLLAVPACATTPAPQVNSALPCATVTLTPMPADSTLAHIETGIELG